MSTAPFARPPVTTYLRLEGLAVALLCLWLYVNLGSGWLLFALVILAPDVAIAAYLLDSSFGALAYNLAHSYLAVIALAVIGALVSPLALSIALIWATHIGVDQALGFGLKYPTGFKDTHLGRL